MSIRQRIYGAFAVWIIGGLALGAAMVYDERFLIPLLVLQVLIASITMRARCPVCGYPVLKRERRTDIGRFTVWVARVPRCCTNCGAPLETFEKPRGAPEARADLVLSQDEPRRISRRPRDGEEQEFREP